jgi:hypothetical protein
VWKRVMGRKQQALQDLDSLKSSSKKAERHLKVASECRQLCRGGGVAALATTLYRQIRSYIRICTCHAQGLLLPMMPHSLSMSAPCSCSGADSPVQLLVHMPNMEAFVVVSCR